MLTDEQRKVLSKINTEIYDYHNGGSDSKHILICNFISQLATALLARQRGLLALKAIVEQLEKCNFECEAGPLRLNTAFIALKEMADAD